MSTLLIAVTTLGVGILIGYRAKPGERPMLGWESLSYRVQFEEERVGTWLTVWKLSEPPERVLTAHVRPPVGWKE